MIDQLELNAVSNRRGQLRDQIKELLQMTPVEQQTVQDALDRFVAGFNVAQAATLRPVPPTATELQEHPPQDTRVFEIAALGGQSDRHNRTRPLRPQTFHFFVPFRPLVGL
jgi:hypothetical protein